MIYKVALHYYTTCPVKTEDITQIIKKMKRQKV